MTTTRQWLLNGHPRGRQIAPDDFRPATVELPAPVPAGAEFSEIERPEEPIGEADETPKNFGEALA